MASDRTELRVEVPREELSVVDGFCVATGRDRTDLIRQILREWSERQLHIATIVCRVAGGNPPHSERDRTANVCQRTNPGSET